MYVDAVEVEFGYHGVVVFRAGVDVEDLELDRPVGSLGIVGTENADLETL